MGNVETYLSLAESISSKLKEQPDVEGVLLFGSAAEGVVTKRSDLDIMVVVKEKRPYWRDCKPIRGIWVEQFFKTYEWLKNTIERKELIHVHMFKDGRILYDPKGRLRELKSIAMVIAEEYKPTEAELRKERISIQTFIDDLRDMYDSGDLESALYYMYDNQYLVLGTLFKINNRFHPKFKDEYREFKDLEFKPPNFDQLMKDILMARRPEKRLESLFEIADWILEGLGGRLTEIKE